MCYARSSHFAIHNTCSISFYQPTWTRSLRRPIICWIYYTSNFGAMQMGCGENLSSRAGVISREGVTARVNTSSSAQHVTQLWTVTLRFPNFSITRLSTEGENDRNCFSCAQLAPWICSEKLINTVREILQEKGLLKEQSLRYFIDLWHLTFNVCIFLYSRLITAIHLSNGVIKVPWEQRWL